MPTLAGSVVDAQTGEKIAARLQVLTAEGWFLHPPQAVLKVGPGLPFFYGDGDFAVEVPWGPTHLLVERGTEYVPARLKVNVAAHGITTVEVALERWSDLAERGWHPGNTHIHYDQYEARPDERLRLDPRVEDLRVTAVSVLKRQERDYAVNKYPAGMLTEFCSAHHYVECGEESRHNDATDNIDGGYGHVMLLRLTNFVEPLSRGYLLDELDPDYPPLSYACDDAHRQGGLVIWCHNGRGLEMPVAAALGKLDAFNLFDPYWTDLEYHAWYAMLNCGFKLPASTGSDWYICSANRVYAYTGRNFDYGDWVSALQAGRTFITNGPALFLAVDDQMPGATIQTEIGKELTVTASWKSHFAVGQVDLVWNGSVFASQTFPAGSYEGRLTAALKVPSDGWLAARVGSPVRDSFNEPIYAHTSPVYVAAGRPAAERGPVATRLAQDLEQALGVVAARYRFKSDRQRQEVVDLFKRGQAVYRELIPTA